MHAKIYIGMIGCGNIGSSIYNNWEQLRCKVWGMYGVELILKKIAVQDIDKKRFIDIPKEKLTIDPFEVTDDPEIQVVIEVMGGTKLAYEIVVRAIKNQKKVVTANKALLALKGEGLLELARENKTRIFYEASVCAGLPVIKVIEESLFANDICSVVGIMNGSTNYILSQVFQHKRTFQEALIEAREKGFLEADDSLDIDGWDVAHKAIIVNYLISNEWVSLDDIKIQGIRQITDEDIFVARSAGYVIKLIAKIKYFPGKRVRICIKPFFIAKTHLFSEVNQSLNAVVIEGSLTGPIIMIGQGAGAKSTTSAIYGDIMESVNCIFSVGQIYPKTSTYSISKNGCSDAVIKYTYLIYTPLQKDSHTDDSIMNELMQLYGSLCMGVQIIEEKGENFLLITTEKLYEDELKHFIDTIALHRYVSGIIRYMAVLE